MRSVWEVDHPCHNFSGMISQHCPITIIIHINFNLIFLPEASLISGTKNYARSCCSYYFSFFNIITRYVCNKCSYVIFNNI